MGRATSAVVVPFPTYLSNNLHLPSHKPSQIRAPFKAIRVPAVDDDQLRRRNWRFIAMMATKLASGESSLAEEARLLQQLNRQMRQLP